MNQEQQLESERGISWTLKKWPEEKKQSKNEDLESEPKMACRRRIESNIEKWEVCWAKFHVNEWAEMRFTNNELISIHKIIKDNNVNCLYPKRMWFSTYKKNAIYTERVYNG